MAATATFLTTSITKIELLCNDHPLGNATGFFLKYQSNWFLVTNWHVFSGRYPESGQPQDKESCAVPDACRFHFASYQEGSLTFNPVIRSLVDASNLEATWFQHPIGGQYFDVAVLPIEANEVGLAMDLFDSNGHDPDMFIDLGDNLFLPGYPLGLSADRFLPIWKRASLASSLELGQGINRLFYVDTATRKGMSGAPCLAISNWPHYSLDRATNKFSVVERPLSWRLLGVYSGRLNPSDSFEAQIGIVWRENLITETILQRSGGNVKLTSSS
jgi:hypothetical protein